MTADAERPTRPTCFVIMPISDAQGYETNHFARVYEHLLKPAIDAAGYSAIRADDAYKSDYIVVSVIQKIVDSEMVLCDLSGRNPNVMYELGLRHAFNKPVTLVKDKVTDKVFDIQGIRYTEYDGSLRIDWVERDIDKITKALRETASADRDDVNSVIQLAGIKAADPPAGRTVSPDTQILLSAIASIERLLDISSLQTKGPRFLSFDGKDVVFSDRTKASLDDEIYDGKGATVGEIVDIHPAEQRIFIRHPEGKIVPYYTNGIRP